MPWLYFALSAVCFAIAIRTQSLGLAALCLVLALGLLIAGSLGLVSRRIQGRAQSPVGLLGPEQVALMRRNATPPAPTAPGPAATDEAATDGGTDAAADREPR